MSTNKVYGDAPNAIRAARNCDTRWDYDDPAYADGIAEDFPHRPEQAQPLRRLQGRRPT